MTIRLGLLLIAIAGGGLPLDAQSPTFEVVSVKPNTGNVGSISLRSRPDGGFIATNVNIGLLLGQAFPQSTQDMVGLPEWATSARFDVNATAPPGIGNATLDQRRAMLRAMLADRFKLATHTETRDVPAYDLVLARNDGKLGPQVTPVGRRLCRACGCPTRDRRCCACSRTAASRAAPTAHGLSN
jgi:uncharacterized protein (TIGR03435 family)